MKKRGIFSLVLSLVAATAIFAAEPYMYLGTAGELVITDTTLTEASVNTSSVVSEITQQTISTLQPASTATVVNTVTGISFNSYGANGALQNATMRGSNSSQVDIYFDGFKLNSAHDGNFDLSLIPVSSFDSIQVIHSGTGSRNTSSAIGGGVLINAKVGTATDKPFAVSIENGSYLPLTYTDSSNTKQNNWLSLVDGQKIGLSYADAFDNGLSIAANVSGQHAFNAYTYADNSDVVRLRENSAFWMVQGGLNVGYSFSEDSQLSFSNITAYKLLQLPGSLSYVTPKDYQNDLLTLTTLGYQLAGALDGLLDLDITNGFVYNQTKYHSEYSDSQHDKMGSQTDVAATWLFTDTVSLKTGLAFDWGMSKSTDSGTHNRYTPKAYLNGSFFLFDGLFSLHPFLSGSWSNDFGFAPNISMGVSVYPIEGMTLSLQASYATNAPSFSDLYWVDNSGYGMVGNPNLRAENATGAEFAISYGNDFFSYEGTAFMRSVKDQIAWVYDSTTFVSKPENIQSAFFTGTEQTIAVRPVDGLSLSASYLLNYTWNLSAGNTFASNVRLPNVRMHTVKFTTAYEFGFGSAALTGSYQSKNASTKGFFLLDAVVNFTIAEDYEVYVAVDNLLNTSYQVVSGYPMPGTQLRIGAKAQF